MLGKEEEEAGWLVLINCYCHSPCCCFLFYFIFFTSEQKSSLMMAPVLGSLLVDGTIMWFHIPASLAPGHHLCTEAVEESESSLRLRLPCVYFDLGHVAPTLGSGFDKGQS